MDSRYIIENHYDEETNTLYVKGSYGENTPYNKVFESWAKYDEQGNRISVKYKDGVIYDCINNKWIYPRPLDKQ